MCWGHIALFLCASYGIKDWSNTTIFEKSVFLSMFAHGIIGVVNYLTNSYELENLHEYCQFINTYICIYHYVLQIQISIIV